ncbi:MAG: hypothetical protein ACFE0K_08880, partial [Alcanivorax sp.]|uniref:hypothetical protein n=1 Tax=Alcanivorax sp. TaxID=1872427 RepID=UPI003DA79D5D
MFWVQPVLLSLLPSFWQRVDTRIRTEIERAAILDDGGMIVGRLRAQFQNVQRPAGNRKPGS